jgi:hypothetical protein
VEVEVEVEVGVKELSRGRMEMGRVTKNARQQQGQGNA